MSIAEQDRKGRATVDQAAISRTIEQRVSDPASIARAWAERRRPTSLVGSTGRLMLVAADHPARGALRAGDDAFAMGDRARLLDRMVGTADVLDDLLLLGALEGKVVIGSMNRGGLAGTAFEIDDRFTGHDAATIKRDGMQGGKMLFRIEPDDAGTVATMQACAEAVRDLAEAQVMAMVEPFISHRRDGRVVNDLSTAAVVRSATVAAGLAPTSAYTWLKLPVVDDMAAVLSATGLPVLLLGGEVSSDQEAQFAAWSKALAHPAVRGMVVGRSLLFPPDGDVEAAVDATVAML